jgi:hypothetical protein
VKRLTWGARLQAVAALGVVLAWAPQASADSIQRAGLTTGIPEGFGRTPGIYVASMLDFGLRSTDPSITKQTVFIPIFFTWSTPIDIGKTHVSVKGAPGIGVVERAPGLGKIRPYNPYGSVWFSWFLGKGLNLSVGEGVQIGLANDLTRAIGRDYSAFQQNVAVSYVKNNWNVTGNSFYTAGRTRASGSQPDTLNLDFTAIKRVARREYGAIGYGEWDLNSPAVGYLGGGKKQSEVAVGVLWGYLIGNLVAVDGRVTTDLYQNNFGGRDTRFTVMAIFPLWTPGAGRPKHAK